MKKLLFDIFPLILFFIAYRVADIYTATAVAMVAAVGQILWLKMRQNRIEAMHWVTLVVIVLFGGATLWLQDEAFIMWKPTILNWIFGSSLLVSQLVFKRNLLRSMLGHQIPMAAEGWDRMSLSWAGFFFIAGILNVVVAFSGYFTESQWVTFRVFGLTSLMIVFVIVQTLFLAKYIERHDESESDKA